MTMAALSIAMAGSLATTTIANAATDQTDSSGSEVVRVHKVSFGSEKELDKNVGSSEIGKVADPQAGVKFSVYDVTKDFEASFAKTKSIEKTQAELNSKTWSEKNMKAIASGQTNDQGIFAYEAKFEAGKRIALLFQQTKTTDEKEAAKPFVLVLPTQDENGVNEDVVNVYAKTVIPPKVVKKNKEVVETTTIHKKLTQTDENLKIKNIAIGITLLTAGSMILVAIHVSKKLGKEK